MSKILIASDVPVISDEGRMAGLQIRVYEMARALARKGHEVTIAAPEPLPTRAIFSGVRCVAPGEINRSSGFDVWIAHPLVAGRYFARLADVPYVMDGYEAPFASFLSHSAALFPLLGDRVLHDYRNLMARFLRALDNADRVLCANENQRLCYLSLLCVLGKINPKHPAEDMLLLVQSGAPPESPEATGDRQACPIVLWVGGCYPWFDPETFVAAMPLIIARVPEVRFVFAGIGGSGERDAEPREMPSAQRVFKSIQESEELRARSRFVAWQPYAERGALYASADVAVCSYRRQIETTFSMRTRIIDMVWGGLPVVATEGDAVGAALEAAGAGIVVPAEEPERLADAVVGLLTDQAKRGHMTAAAKALAAGVWSWDAQIQPLDQYCRFPSFAPGGADAPLRRTVRGMIQIRDGISWRFVDRGMRAFWRARRAVKMLQAEGVGAVISKGWLAVNGA